MYNNDLVTIDKIYPIGSVYISLDPAFNPTNNFIGTWNLIDSGYILQSTKTASVVGTTAGKKNITLTSLNIPKLTTGNENVSHTHSFGMDISAGNNQTNIAATGIVYGISNYAGTIITTNQSTSHTHSVGNNSPSSFSIEYSNIKVYMWKRIA